jgi:serine/threonine protein kinase
VVGLLMPKAAGKNPLEYSVEKARKGDDGDTEHVKSNVSRSDLKPMAQSALNLIKGLAKHGFIHGDIKPENLFWDAKTKALQLIDNDGLQKVSKKAGSVVPKGLGALTLAYLHPLAYHKKFLHAPGGPGKNAQLGLGRDLYAMGLVMLEASLLAEGMSGEEVQGVMESITHGHQPVAKIEYLLATNSIEDRIKTLNGIEGMKAGGMAEFARKCIIKALEFEQERVGPEEESESDDGSEGRQSVSAKTKSYTFDRSDTGPEAKLLEELQEELDQVQ